jgi:hypothetical protein
MRERPLRPKLCHKIPDPDGATDAFREFVAHVNTFNITEANEVRLILQHVHGVVVTWQPGKIARVPSEPCP